MPFVLGRWVVETHSSFHLEQICSTHYPPMLYAWRAYSDYWQVEEEVFLEALAPKN